MKSTTKGFSLIELLIVVGIIGLLAAIALPLYQSSIYKSRSSELLGFASKQKTDVAEYLLFEGANTLTATTCQNIAAASANVDSDITKSWAITSNCVITATSVAGKIGGGTAQMTLKLTPTLESDGSLSWVCTSDNDDYVPSTCR